MQHQALEASFDQLAATLAATVGVAIAARTGPYSLGDLKSSVAWSTIKVPLAIAALRNGRPEAKDLIHRAIAKSDNAASEALWSQLGEPADAAQKVQAIIAGTGDRDTVVQSQRVRRGYTPFGQTQWTLSRQAVFAAQLPHIPDAAYVIDLMRNLTEDHRWGLAAKSYAAKGGWGPGTDGTYLARQFAIVPTESAHLGIALAAEAHDGNFATATATLDTITDWLLEHLPH
jgi:hypothetical protein